MSTGAPTGGDRTHPDLATAGEGSARRLGGTFSLYLVPSELVRVTPERWRLQRDVRLRALADSPDAFSTTLGEASALTDDELRRRAAGGGIALVAVVEDVGVGMGGAFAPPDRSTVYVWGMWVDPSARGQGLGSRLLDELVAWCRDPDHAGPTYDEVRLHVTEGNGGARRLYVNRGFRPTGTWEPLRTGSPLRVEEFSLAL